MDNEEKQDSLPPTFCKEAARLFVRIGLSTAVLLVLSGSIAAVIDRNFGLDYMIIGLWTLIFFTLTALIIRAVVIEKRKVLGLALICGKFLWMLGLILCCLPWQEGGAALIDHEAAIVTGIVTPIAAAVVFSLIYSRK